MRYQSAEDAPSATKPTATHTVYVRSHDTSLISSETIVARDATARVSAVSSEATVSPVSETVRHLDLPCRRCEVRVRTSGGGERPGVDCRGLRATRDSDEPRGRIADLRMGEGY